MRHAAGGGLLLIGLLALGCKQTDYPLDVPRVQEFQVAPAGDKRFDEPPTQGYRTPAPKKEFKPGLSPGGMGGGAPNT